MIRENKTVELFGTIGPACSSQNVLEDMLREGMTGIRLNLSHSGLKESAGMLEAFAKAREKTGIHAELLIDLQGPELRSGPLAGPLFLHEGDKVRLVSTGHQEKEDIPLPDEVLRAVRAGDHILLDDAGMELIACGDADVVKACDAAGDVLALPGTVLRGGTLGSRKTVRIPERDIRMPVLTSEDIRNLHEAGKYGVTAVMQPFVTSGKDLSDVRSVLARNSLVSARVFAKIENRRGAAALEDIAEYADMIVIARGDLGSDVPLWELPAVQKDIAARCRKMNKPFLVVTQMLTSMIINPVPTRAEVSDIFNAVGDGASALMVTNETAVGSCPAQVIRYLKRTAETAVRFYAGAVPAFRA